MTGPSGLSRQVCNMNGNSVTPPHAGLSRLGQLGLDSGHSIQLAISRHSTDRHSTHYLSLRSSHKVSFSNIFYLLPVCLTEKNIICPHPIPRVSVSHEAKFLSNFLFGSSLFSVCRMFSVRIFLKPHCYLTTFHHCITLLPLPRLLSPMYSKPRFILQEIPVSFHTGSKPFPLSFIFSPTSQDPA